MSQPANRPDETPHDGATASVKPSRWQCGLDRALPGHTFTSAGRKKADKFDWRLGIAPMSWAERLKYAATVTAFGATVALVVNYRKQRDTEQGRFAANFADACAQLGGEAPAVRLGGVHALAALADRQSDTQRRQQCIDALCAYLRLPHDPTVGNDLTTETTDDAGGKTTTGTLRPADREVRLTIIRIIRDHLQDPEAKNTWIGHRLDFTGAVFDGGDFDRAHFSGPTRFDQATFAGEQVSFAKATFSAGTVSFAGATFSAGTVSFAGATFSGGGVMFVGATFSAGTVSFAGATFSGRRVEFMRAKFSGGRVSFAGATFSGRWVSFAGATFSGRWVSFAMARFSGGRVSFAMARFSDGTVMFAAATFSGGTVSFAGATFSGGRLVFDQAKFSGALVVFDQAKFSGALVVFDQATFSDGTVSFDEATFPGGDVLRDGKPFRGWPESVTSS